jgi:hypothetical protein
MMILKKLTQMDDESGNKIWAFGWTVEAKLISITY